MVRLLVVGDGGAPTGFARVLHSILRRLPNARYDLHQLAVNYFGDPHGEPWQMYPALLGGDPHGVGRLSALVRRLEPDVVFTLADPWIQARYLDVLRTARGKSRVVTYTPVDAGPLDPEWLRDACVADRFVVYTEFGRREVLSALGIGELRSLSVLPHGVDTEVFFPLPAENGRSGASRAKQELGIEAEASEESFVVLNANRNQVRKCIASTIEAFARFARGKPDGVRLYLHMGPKDAGWDLRKLATRYGVDDRLVLTDSGTEKQPRLSNIELNTIYNACDVGLSTSSAEGWGLPAFELSIAGPSEPPMFGST